MRVDCNRFFALPKPCLLWLAFEQVVDKFFEKKTALRNGFDAGNLQLAIVLGKHRVAGGLEENNRK